MLKREHERLTKGIRTSLKNKEVSIAKLREEVNDVEELWVKTLNANKALVELVNTIEDCANPEIKKSD